MTVIAAAIDHGPRGAPRPVLLAIAVGWALAIVAELTGKAHALHHDALIDHGPPLWSARRGAGNAFRLGSGHGVFCLGCCWALMLVMFAAGVAMLWWMAALTAVMVYEKTGRYGSALTPLVGVVLLGLAAVAFAHPPWFPTPFVH